MSSVSLDLLPQTHWAAAKPLPQPLPLPLSLPASDQEQHHKLSPSPPALPIAHSPAHSHSSCAKTPLLKNHPIDFDFLHPKPPPPSNNPFPQLSPSSSSQNDPKPSKDVKKRSSKACDNCRKSKCKCTRAPDPDGVIPSNKPCQNCITNGLECTFNGASRKRGPPKGYIEAIESRLHRMEAFLGGLLENDDPRAQALFSELVGDSQVGKLLQNDLKLSAQSTSNKSRKSWKPPDISTANPGSVDHRNKVQLTDTQKALWGVHLDQFTAFREHRSDNPGPLSSGPDDDSECENDPPDRSPPPDHDDKYHHHRTRRRRLGSHPPSNRRRSKLSIPTFNHPPPNAIIPHTATATFTLTRTESSNTSQEFYRLGDNHMQSPNSNTLTTQQHSPATLSELEDVVGQLSLDENDEVRYHGRSSGLYLISASQRYKNFFWHFPKPGFWPVAPIRRSHSILDIFELVDPLQVLPSREMMNHLLDYYWAFVHPMMPVLYKAEFLIQFEYLIKNVDRIKQARPYWTDNQVWCHALSGTSSCNDASPSDSSYHYSPSPPLEQLEPRVDGLEPTNRISMLLLLVIFAISSRYSNRSSSPPVEGQYWNAGDKYLAKAKQILNLDYGNSKLTNCQALILMAYREIGSGAMGESWLYTGMAIRMAQDMGLFRDVDKWFMPVKRFTYEEKQIRKRLWWACVNMDKYVSTYIGRPMMIFERDYDTAFPSTDEPDEHEQWKGWSPDGQTINPPPVTNQKQDSTTTEVLENDKKPTEEKQPPSLEQQSFFTNGSSAASTQEKSYTISCFSRSASLSVLISRIVANIYAIRIRVIGQSSETLLSLLDQNLARWYLDLPEQLQYNPQPLPQTPNNPNPSSFASSSKGALSPHLLTLHAQFYTALILLHRPFIPASHLQADLNSNRPVDSPPSSPSHSICTTAANAITSIAQAYSQLFGLRQAPAFLVYYIFTAAILHVYNVGSDAGLALTAKANLLKCMNSLKEMAPTWTGAVRAWELLVGLVDLRDHDQSDDHQQSSQPNASNLDRDSLQKLNHPEDRRLKRPASASDAEEQMKPFSGLTNPHPSSSKPNTANPKLFDASFDQSQLNFDWIANHEVPQSKPGAPYGSMKLVRSVSDNMDANAMKQMNTISINNPVCEQDIHLLQPTSSESQVRASNQPRQSVCDEKDLSGFRIESPKLAATAGNPRAPSTNKDGANQVGLNYKPNCDFPGEDSDRHYSNGPMALPTTALEEMMGLINHSSHLYDYHHQPALQTPIPPPTQSQLQTSQEPQQFEPYMNQGLSPLVFDLNSFTPSPTSAHPPYGATNQPEISFTTMQGVFGLGGPVPQRGKPAGEGMVKSQQNRMVFGNPNAAGDKVEPERERYYPQERMRAASSICLKDNVSFDGIFSDSGLNWLPSPIDSIGGYGTDPGYQIVLNPQSHPPPQTSNPHHPTHPTHPLHNYHNYHLNRTQHH